jgi:hypothetical protein
MDAIRCRSRYILDKDQECEGVNDNDMGYNRAYGVVLRCAKDAELAKTVDIHLEAIVQPGLSHYVDFFNPIASTWTDSFGSQVSGLELCVQEDTPWGIDLLRSVRNLRRLKLYSCNGDNYFSHPTSGPLTWPRLHQLNLSDLPCSHDTLVTFFKTHQATLTYSTLHWKTEPGEAH